jgi:tRNA U38,U39,U40 pseudouridine synthase TruA
MALDQEVKSKNQNKVRFLKQVRIHLQITSVEVIPIVANSFSEMQNSLWEGGY